MVQQTKRAIEGDKAHLVNYIAATNWLINLKTDPNPELLEKLEKLMHLKSELEEINSKDAVRKHRAKLLSEGEKPTKYFCSLHKVVEKHTVITELHIVQEQETGPPIIESIKEQAQIEA